MSDTYLQRAMVLEQYIANESPKMGYAFLFWAFFGILAAHRFYMRQPSKAFALLLANFLFVGLFWTWLVEPLLISGAIRAQRMKMRKEFVLG
jgi:TM2 domain-containing membrane protein YozV